jgi:hypothetical protein
MTIIQPRLRKPAMYTLAGLLFAAAWLVHGGRRHARLHLMLTGARGRSPPLACPAHVPGVQASDALTVQAVSVTRL